MLMIDGNKIIRKALEILELILKIITILINE